MRFTLPIFFGLTIFLLVGCGGSIAENTSFPTKKPPANPIQAGTGFNPATAGTITGTVTWEGEIPKQTSLTVPISEKSGSYLWTDVPTPFVPKVDPTSRGVQGAVVYLKGLNASLGRPWDKPSVCVEHHQANLFVQQGEQRNLSVGFVRLGDEIEMVSMQGGNHNIRARGAAYFSLPFPEPGQRLKKRLDQRGHIEFSSGTGHFWTLADLFVDDHPYYTMTDSQGKFLLPQVPPGRYELVCWVRNWNVAVKERNPETGLIFRQQFASPVELTKNIALSPQGNEQQTFVFRASNFSISEKHK